MEPLQPPPVPGVMEEGLPGGAPPSPGDPSSLVGSGPVVDEPVEPSAILPFESKRKSFLKSLPEDTVRKIEGEIQDILSQHESMMRKKVDRWVEIQNSYNLLPDPQRAGHAAHAERLVSEMTRSHVNIATARLEESIMGLDPMIECKVWDDQAGGADTELLLKEAKALELFLNSYMVHVNDIRTWLPMAIHRACKLGASVFRVMWEIETERYLFRDISKDREVKKKQGKLVTKLINNDQVVVWPVYRNINKASVVGHQSPMQVGEFRQFAIGSLGLEKSEVDDLVALASGDRPDRLLSEDLKGMDHGETDTRQKPGVDEVIVVELWLMNYFVPGKEDDGPQDLQLIFHREAGRLLYLEKNPLHSRRRHPYFLVPYWKEDNSAWGSGVGHELLYAQAADSSLLNMMIDNLKVLGNNLIVIRSNSMAEELASDIAPGRKIFTENPTEDLISQPMGGDMSHIQYAFQNNEMRAMKGSGITMPEQGMADPVLKSGASPGSYQQLLASSGRKFGKVDKNMREPLSEFAMFAMETIQQYAPTKLYYDATTDENARILEKADFRIPTGDLGKKFRLVARAPSATSNKEVRKQNLMVLYQMTMSHMPAFFQFLDMTMAQQNPAGAQMVKEDLLRFFHNSLYRQIVEDQEVPGMSERVPQIEDPTPVEQQLNQLIQENQQLVMQLQQMQQQMQPPMPGGMDGPPQGGMGGPPAM